MAQASTPFGDWLAQLTAARETSTLDQVRDRIEHEMQKAGTPRLSVSAGQLGPRVWVPGSNAAKDYLWLRYGAKGVPSTPANFDATARACADFMNVPPGLLRFYDKGPNPSRPEDRQWASSYRLALAREQVSLDVELSGQSLTTFVHASAAAIFKSTLGTSGPILMLTSHLGYGRVRGLMGATLARDVTTAGARTGLDRATSRALAFRAIKCLAGGGVLFIAPDGPNGEHRQKVNLRGMSIDVSTGASRLAYDAKARVVFLSTHYNNGQFSPRLHHGPEVTPTDTRAGFVEKVTRFYERCLIEILWGDPEQLIIPYQFYPVLSHRP